MATVLTRTLAAACLLALLVAGCGGDDATEEPQARPTLSDPAAVPTAVPDEGREPYRIGQTGVNAPGVDVTATVAPAEPTSTTYNVQEGDTCGGIASNHGITVDALLAANARINDDCTNLHVDEVLTIPAPDPSASPPEASSSDTGDTRDTPTGARVYIVVPGDTCAAIAQDHDIPLQTFLVANGLDEESCLTIQVGQEVIIPE